MHGLADFVEQLYLFAPHIYQCSQKRTRAVFVFIIV